jgi:diguanylate cyclase (GGDEF)-like protein
MRFLFRFPAVCALTLACAAGPAQVAEPPNLPLRTLVTAHEAHELSIEEAARGYPVHLRAVVTYYDPYIDRRHGALFVHDSTGAIFIGVPAQPILPLRAGTEVDIVGVSGTGDFAPIVARGAVHVVGQLQVPKSAPRVTMAELLSGGEDGQWVEVEGVVHSVLYQPTNVSLEITTAGGPVTATTPREASADYDSLADSLVRVHANAAPVFNRSRQMVGAHLFFPSLKEVTVVEGAPADPYAKPAVPVSRLLQFSPGMGLPHRAHVQGRVTLQWPGRVLCIQQAVDGLCMQTPKSEAVRPGDVVDVVGFPAISDYKATLEDATFRLAGGGLPQTATPITATEAFGGDHDRELVQIEGELIGQDLAAGDPTLMLRSGKFLFAATLPRESSIPGRLPWKDGSVLRLTGVCSVRMDPRSTNQGEGVVRPESVDILLRSPQDVAVLHAPSWWTPTHALTVLSIVGTFAFLAFAWIVVLRRRVEQQTQAIRLSEERLRHMSEHDPLTGLPNRFLLNDRLDMALKRAGRFDDMLGLLMVDLDRFKEVNDSLGHHAGDKVLCEVAKRICGSVRQTDTVARLGGDEFIVLLPDLHNPTEAEKIAAKIVAAVSTPIDAGSGTVLISASIGVCAAMQRGGDAERLFRCVDSAMYGAKAHGKNRYQVYRSETEGAAIV